ncbi:MAG TPA: hypothetical protein VLQ91_21065 [Draconibacterium sp.]|jgi:hypothetical protein|nr:hypothetical protein [Draconibacterium sp.]
MQTIAKLIHRTTASYLPTAFPAHYYGMPNGRIYIIYSRFYEIKFSGSGLEFVFAVHKEFKYDYENEIIIPKKKFNKKTPVFSELVDMPDSRINIIKICRGLNSYGEAFNLLNSNPFPFSELTGSNSFEVFKYPHKTAH